MITEPTQSQPEDQDQDWEKKYLDSLGQNPNSARAKRSRLEKYLRRIARRLLHPENFFLRRVSGIIHVGAHVGQECDQYAEEGLNVLWIEPNPGIFRTLSKALTNYPKQTALRYLVTDVDGRDYVLHISSNRSASSSILEPGAHKELWPEVTFDESIPLKGITLSSMVKREGVDLDRYDALVMDTQGSELLVLKGAVDLLDRFKFIKAEAADFEIYKGCCTLADLDLFLSARNFGRVRTKRFAHKSGLGSCYDAVWKNLR